MSACCEAKKPQNCSRGFVSAWGKRRQSGIFSDVQPCGQQLKDCNPSTSSVNEPRDTHLLLAAPYERNNLGWKCVVLPEDEPQTQKAVFSDCLECVSLEGLGHHFMFTVRNSLPSPVRFFKDPA